MTVCSTCSKHGKITWEDEPKPNAIAKPKETKNPIKVFRKKTPELPAETTLELAESFAAKIRQAREKLGLSHEDLGKKINEKVSVLRKIETGKMKPNNMLAAKLERTLKAKLVVSVSEETPKIPMGKLAKPASRDLTLGDLIQLDNKRKDKEDTAEREQS